MFEIVKTGEGWVVRSTETGRNVAGPFVSLLDASCEREELEFECAREEAMLAGVGHDPLL